MARARLELIPGGEPGEEPRDEAPPPRAAVAPHADEEIVAAIRAGEPWAAAALHDRVRPAVDRTLRRIVGARDADYSDLAQNALIEIASTMHRYRGDCSLDSWTATITSRLVYKQFRRRTLERKLFRVLDEEHFEIGGAPPARAAEAKRLLSRVVEHLRAMDNGRAWAFWLHDVCGHDLREVAEICDVSVAAAQSRLVRGRKELHERIRTDPELADAMAEVEP